MLTPVSPDELKPGYTLQFTAIGTYSDGAIVDVTSLASWTSSNTNVATISLGLVTAVAEGTARITATKAWLPSQAITLSVIAPEVTLSAIEVTPTLPVELAIGETLQFAASGKYSDGTSADITLQVTWESSNTGAATVSEAGLATGIAAGTTEVTASASGVTSPAVILEITPN
ncbi:MAG TPA: Ig-like domain-containing protein [Dehalococcoidales bacterium]|nr:Ig-like domain-containing protein [Dehalococcoidales bacterium]